MENCTLKLKAVIREIFFPSISTVKFRGRSLSMNTSKETRKIWRISICEVSDATLLSCMVRQTIRNVHDQPESLCSDLWVVI